MGGRNPPHDFGKDIKGQMKECCKCHLTKDLNEFPINKRRNDGRGSWCKACTNTYSKAYYYNNWDEIKEKRKPYRKTKEQNRRSNIKQYFKITVEEYDARRKAQGDNCALCDKETADLVLDHDHITGKLRSFICRSCNTKLGWFEKRQEKIIAYIN